ncbi:MAG: SH3 domain-containing protein [bacterium]|nr:SH3 domain-containing protein [bacterium]
MRRISLVLCVTLCMCMIAGGAAAQFAGIDVTTVDRANVRSGPGTEWRILTTLEPGTPVRLDGKAPSGDYWVRGIVPDGTVGWLAADATTLTPDQVAALPGLWVDAPFTLPAPGSAPAPAAPAENPPADSAPAPAADPTAVPQADMPAPIANAAPARGFAYGGHVADWSAYASEQMARAGMTWVKRQWRYAAGQDPGMVAGWINDAHARGFRILLGVVGEPGALYTDGFFDQYAAFVGGVAALGADAIEVWNEVNIDREWPAGRISAADYTQLLARSYNAIKAANPATMVISAAPAPTGFFGGCSGAGCDDNLYVRAMYDAGAANYMDCLGIHYNEGILPPTATSGDPRGSSSHYSRYFRSMMQTYRAAFNNARPLCFTEMGYVSAEGYPPLPAGFAWAENVTVAQQAAWLDSAVSMAAATGYVRLFIIWNIDFTRYDSDPQAGFAIIRPGGACPACDALGS